MSDIRTSFLSRRWPRFWAVIGIFTILGLIDAYQFYVHVRNFRGNRIYLEEALAIGLGNWYFWAALSPFVFWLGRRFPFSYANWRSRLFIHLYFGCLVILVKIAFDLLLHFAVIGKDVLILPLEPDDRQLTNHEYLLPLYRNLVFANFFIYVLVYGVIVGLAQFLDYYRRVQERELLASRLETQLAQAQLQVLRMQLQPHFLFNTLNAISALMHKDVRLADRMLARLGELLRATLEDPGTQGGTLRQELDFLRPYLEIEQARLGPRLTVTIDVPAELLDARVPYLIAQPLVENAIRHGLAPRIGPGSLSIRARRQNDLLTIQVTDDGVGFPANGHAREGIGLSNTRGRLRGLYGDDAALTLETDPGRGTVATVTLPYRSDAADSGDRPTPIPAAPRSSDSHRSPDPRDEVASAYR